MASSRGKPFLVKAGEQLSVDDYSVGVRIRHRYECIFYVPEGWRLHWLNLDTQSLSGGFDSFQIPLKPFGRHFVWGEKQEGYAPSAWQGLL